MGCGLWAVRNILKYIGRTDFLSFKFPVDKDLQGCYRNSCHPWTQNTGLLCWGAHICLVSRKPRRMLLFVN